VTFFSPLPTKAFVEQGKLRLLGVTTKQRSAAMANVRTIAEQGLADYDFPGWYGLAVPAATPPQVVAALHRAAAKALEKPSVKEFLLSNGLTPGGGSSAEFAALLKSEVPRWTELARKIGAKPD
jgi:tripartite-type tricarboxylate transporter receptor subunit TctC